MDKLLAEWFWVDRWMGSSAFLLPIEPRGLYREMLSQAWRRGARLPADPEAIRRAVGCTAAEWRRCWPQIERFWRLDGEALVNETQLLVYAEAKAAAERASHRGHKGGLASAQARRKLNSRSTQVGTHVGREQVLKHQPPSPSPDLRTYKPTGAAAPACVKPVGNSPEPHATPSDAEADRVSPALRDRPGSAAGGTVDAGRGVESAGQGSPVGLGICVPGRSGDADAGAECGLDGARETLRDAADPDAAGATDPRPAAAGRSAVAGAAGHRRRAHVAARTGDEPRELDQFRRTLSKAWSAR